LLRRAWVKYLKSNEVDSSRWTKEKQKEIFEWANETDISADMLSNILDKRKEERRGKSKKTT
jgi:GTP-binding protein EngB required for normal cell division